MPPRLWILHHCLSGQWHGADDGKLHQSLPWLRRSLRSLCSVYESHFRLTSATVRGLCRCLRSLRYWMCQTRPRALPPLCRILSSLCRILPSNVDGNGLDKTYLFKVYLSRSTLYWNRELSLNKIPKNCDWISQPSSILRQSQKNVKFSNIFTENMGEIRDRCHLFKRRIGGMFRSHNAIAVHNRNYTHDQSSRRFISQLI